MSIISCPICGGKEFDELKGYRICQYCGTKHKIPKEELPKKQSNISLNSDVERLLERCKREPSNAKKYANLVLDIDPTNEDALKYL